MPTKLLVEFYWRQFWLLILGTSYSVHEGTGAPAHRKMFLVGFESLYGTMGAGCSRYSGPECIFQLEMVWGGKGEKSLLDFCANNVCGHPWQWGISFAVECANTDGDCSCCREAGMEKCLVADNTDAMKNRVMQTSFIMPCKITLGFLPIVFQPEIGTTTVFSPPA